MLAVAYYLLKVVICSGILYGYYRLALHNKIFHRWNRFYLLGAVLMSLAFPLITISIFHTPAEDDGQVIRLLNVVTTGEAFVHDANGNGAFRPTGEEIVSFVYLIVSLVFLTLLFQTLVRLRNIVKHHYSKNIEGIHFVDTEAKGTPFSFFNYIFWNRNINIESETGRKVFLHELAHVKERHSADRLFMNIVMIFFWSNPFFWLIRREMNMIHEFIADSEAVDNNDTADFAAMILQVAYPQRSFGLTSNFFSSSVKRRLFMLTKMQTPRTSYISRVLVLPLLAIVFVAFTIRTKQAAAEPVIALEKTLNVVIDAGHGGDDGGARSQEGIFEKDLTLALAKKIKELNSNNNINIILTRSEDVHQPVKGKVDFALEQNADAFISIHVAAAPQPSDVGKGFEIFLSRRNDSTSLLAQKARLLASVVTEEIQKTYTIAKDIKQSRQKGIWVLDAEQINYPSILVECGYMTDSKDLRFLKEETNQERIAKDILKAIERYTKALEENAVSLSLGTAQKDVYTATKGFDASEKSGKIDAKYVNYPANHPEAVKKFGAKAVNGVAIFEAEEVSATLTQNKKPIAQNTDTLKIKSIDITSDGNVIVIYENNKAEKLTREEAIKRKLINEPGTTPNTSGVFLKGGPQLDEVIFFVDDKEVTKEEVDQLKGSDIESINVYKGMDAIDKYGLRARKGVVEIETKKVTEQHPSGVSIVSYQEDKIFVKVEKEATFPGGNAAFVKYMKEALNKYTDELKKENATGTCVIRFIVKADGNISNLEARTMRGTRLSEIAMDAIKNGPKWNPAMQNGKKVSAYRHQPVSFTISSDSKL